MTVRRILTTLAVLALGVDLTAPAARGAACTPSGCPAACCNEIASGVPLGTTHTYQATSVAGPKLCTTDSASNRFGACTRDGPDGTGNANCGGVNPTCTAGACSNQTKSCSVAADCDFFCRALPWLTIGGSPLANVGSTRAVVIPFPLGVTTTFTLNENTNTASCRHTGCVACGNLVNCPGTPALPGACTGAGQPVACCTGVGTGNCTCCSSPGFHVPSFYIRDLNFCSRTDQTGCGDGVVNSRNPQNGADLDVTKKGDSTQPTGANCTYQTGNNNCANTDRFGRITSAYGNVPAPASGIQSRFRIPIASTTWIDTTGTAGCPTTATWDAGEQLVTQFLLVLEPTTATATGQFVDLNGDSCSIGTGTPPSAGFTNSMRADKVGPVTVTGIAGPYAGGGSRQVAAQPIFPGASPLFDIGFVTITPLGAVTQVTPTQSCSCTVPGGCPETLTSP